MCCGCFGCGLRRVSKKDERLAALRSDVEPIRGVHAQHTYWRYVADFPHVRCSLRLTVCQNRGAMVCASGDAEAHRKLYVAAPRKVRRGWIKVHRGVAARSTQRTGAQGMSYTLAAAIAACGPHKSTVLRAIKAGKISGTKDEHGKWHIEAAELHRVYPPVAAAAAGNGALPRDAMPAEHLR